ncbi:hypothetical protein J4474_01565 [Candidatus Pacearchaeota archaeon]|nr:hypothetical protein [Candidatus Pacearchaeota archaeon]
MKRDEEIQNGIESAKKRLKRKYNFEFPIPIFIIDGIGAGIRQDKIFLGRENPLELIEVLVMHEAYHIIFRIDQVESGSLKKRDERDILPYVEEEMWIWNKMREDFPDLSGDITSAIIVEMAILKSGDFKTWNPL